MSTNVRLAWAGFSLGIALMGCTGAKPKPSLPGGPPPEYEAPRSFDLPGSSAPSPLPSETAVPYVIPPEGPPKK